MNAPARRLRPPFLRQFLLVLPLLCALLGAVMLPAEAAAQGAPMALRGRTLDGQDLDLARLRGQVVMVVMWRTDCAVCLDKMPELRANAQGWKGKPFHLVLVNLDTRSQDAEAYDRLRRQMAGSEGPLLSLWHGDTDLPPSWRGAARLPLTLVIDRSGQLAARHEGRIPPAAWDQVADLLP